MDFLIEPNSGLLLLYLGTPNTFQRKEKKYEYLHNYGWEANVEEMNDVDRLFNLMKESNPARIPEKNHILYSLHLLKENLWEK